MKQQEQERAIKAERAKKKAEKRGTASSAVTLATGKERVSAVHEQGKKGVKRKGGAESVIIADYATEADLKTTKEVDGLRAKEEEDTFARSLADGRKISDQQPALVTGGVLRDYQLKGVEWLKVR